MSRDFGSFLPGETEELPEEAGFPTSYPPNCLDLFLFHLSD